LLDNGLLKHVSRQRTRLDESRRCPEIESRFVETDETEEIRGAVRPGDFYEGRLSVIKGSGFVNSSESRVWRRVRITSIVAPRVVKVDRKGTQFRGV
jgi:hypothetical protein